MATTRMPSRFGGALALAGVCCLVGTGQAMAHVSAVPDEAAKGGYATIALRVPNERPDASTVSVAVGFPADQPLASVRTQPQPGWTIEVERADEESEDSPVSTVTWTAEDGAEIGPDQFQEFSLSLGGLPTDTDQLVLPVDQTYDSGEVVSWDEPPADGEEEPERPAPVVTLVDSEDTGHGHGVDSATGSADETTDDAAESAGQTQDDTARLLGGGGLVVGALGVGFGIGAILRSKKR
ncbi:YcnI family copper-binding membrane protein [Actinoalloteichus hymeniacidonis]|uniref:YncI copper-binding domain-containing protein n=1 Tax=Actinoalloteichus hymeniacidonis TaxID=340345 RepID=A0AAC9HK33_9PSEU|nr:YcnI family protein [Actinoalloteichus hymeniacidonis]AOS60897.1 hypothetical protein TL08_00240 [Actinoalloteichus hymeniacidonis]MBB5911103.1 uncharacterized protein YcnI [Actinoalloteichus hymeniacidonis]